MNKLEISKQRFSLFIEEKVMYCGLECDIQIIFDGEDFHSERIYDKSFIRGYVMKQQDILAVKLMADNIDVHLKACLDYFLKVESLEIVLT